MLLPPVMQHSTRLLSFLAATSLLAACNEVETGRYGLVDFLPDDCGAAFCDLDDRLAVDAATDVYTWKLLRRDLALGRQETERTIVGLVTGVLLAAGDNEEGDNR